LVRAGIAGIGIIWKAMENGFVATGPAVGGGKAPSPMSDSTAGRVAVV
jgi:hypothetical protein